MRLKSLLFLIIFSLASCGGGGGGGGGGGSNSGSSSSSSSSTSGVSSFTSSDASSYRTTEYNNQSGLETIEAAESYAYLALNSKTNAGAGVSIAILDTGVQINHNEISANYTSTGSYDFVNSDSNPSDDKGHGTAVASVAAGVKDGSGMHGVAYDSDIIAIKVLNSSGSGGSHSAVASGIDKAIIYGAKVINMSLGSLAGSTTLRNALISAKAADILSVAATGNETASQPEYPAYYASDSSLSGYVLAVGSVGTSTSSTTISTFSNYCGNAANYCLVAPGYEIYDASYSSSGVTNGYEKDSGTSMSTPMVAGAAAVIRGAWPFLTAAQTANILLSTATDLGTSGVDTIYGHGLLNLYAAVQAQGQNNFAYGSSVSSSGYDVRSSSLVSDPIFGDAFVLNVAPQLASAVFFDDYGRDYKAFMNERISTRSNSNIAASLTNLAFNNYYTQIIPLSFGKNSSTQLNFQVKSYEDKSAPNQFGLKFITTDRSREDKTLTSSNGFSFAQNFDNNFSSGLKAGFSVNRDELANLREDKFNNFGFISVNNFAANPFQSFVNNSITSSLNSTTQRNFNQLFVGTKFFDKKFALNFSQQTSYDSSSILSKIGNLQNRVSDLNLSYLPNDATKISVSFGKMNEFDNNILNSKAVGAFEAAGNATTSYLKISASKKIFGNFSVISSFAQGKTIVSGNNLGIFRNYSDIQSRSSSLGLVNEKILGGKVGIIYSQPLRVYSGKAEINVPVARDLEGNVTRYSSTVSLTPKGREQDFEIFYAKNLTLNWFVDPTIKFNLVAQKQPQNIKSAANAYLGFVNFGAKF